MLYTRTTLSEPERNKEVAWLIQNPDLIDYRKYLLSKASLSTVQPKSNKPRIPLSRMHLPRNKHLLKTK